MKKKVLILCTGNSCRSQMAEGALRHFQGDKFEVFSAGMMPSEVNPIAIQVMREIGIDISKQHSKHIDEFVGVPIDYVITVCDSAKKTCPYFPARIKILHWPFPDPPHDEGVTPRVIEEFRGVRDLIVEKFKNFSEN